MSDDHRRRNLTAICGLMLTLVAANGVLTRAASADDAPPPPSSARADDGAYISAQTRIDSRMIDLQVGSPAVGAIVPVRVLLPSTWSPDATRTWPVLYLLQGAHDDYTSWFRNTDVESFTADKDVIVAMPSAGPTGIPTRWLNGGKNSPDYETFEVIELMQLLQRGFHAGHTRAVAGVSTGGYGALVMAAHYPGAFAAAASYSGILDTTYDNMPALLNAIVTREKVSPTALWGDLKANAGVWAADNPYSLVPNLRWTSLFISSGSGLYSGERDNLLGDALESTLWPQAKQFAARLQVLDIPVQTDFYAGGVHDWTDWRREFAKSWPLLAAGLGLT
jgi:S-formylglutathione hydrolase FrmB